MILLSIVFLRLRIFNVHQQFAISRDVFQARGTWCDPRSLHELGECSAPILPNWVDGSHRLIFFYFENCNAALRFRHFKLDAVKAVLILLTPWGAYLTLLDFKTCLLCLSRCLYRAQEVS